ncbi:DUF397 domain-containing protein [Streptomyces sp. NL15-2K]|uniref:DUF397 domain-containing protein n=1 Tax=Streptomyces sp. NL15-2K TaxID=376149 RepID=UPI000F5612F8|nr:MULTISPECIES: DUF397 domain-containing protein [Actinomycetes]WKX11274.1 DUF397 domain-containing protein [Kutzneria buriramensis]GCB47309.1 hypothetical protein SNL152K_4613 [Streptomyces sp. NL15-2K]
MSDQLKWFKSSYSDDEGGDCVEVALAWFKSSHSDDEGGACVEVALPAARTTVHVRDSKVPAGPRLHLGDPAWTAFLADVSAGRPGA